MPDLLVYKKLALTGGGATALDGVDGSALTGNELAFVNVSDILYVYILNATSGAAESSPSIIAPDTNPGNKRWILQGAYLANGSALGTPSSGILDNCTVTTPSDNTSGTGPANTAYAKSQDAVLAREPDQGVAMTAAASGSSGITVADNDNIDLGTGNCFFVFKGSLADWSPASATQVMLNRNTVAFGISDPANTGYIRLDTTGWNKYSTTAVPNIDNAVHEIVAVVTRETASVAGSISFYCDGVQLGAAVEITAGTPDSWSSANPLYILGSASTRIAGTCIHAIMGNFAPTAAEVLDMYRNGIPESWKWGSQTSIITGNDSTFAGASNWANVDLNAYDETGDLTITATASGQYCTLPIANAGTTATKKYRLEMDVANIVSTWTIKSFDGTQTIGTISANGTAQKIEFTASTTGGLRIVAAANDSSGDFDNFLLYPIGATLALLPEGIQNDKWYDASSNGLNATYPASGWSLTRPIPMNGDMLLSSTTVSFAANADTTLYTVPTGKSCILTKALVVAGADAGATTALSIGADGAETDFVPAAVLSNLDAANDTVILQPVPVAALPTKNKVYAAGTVIQAQVTNQSGGATNTVYLFGFLY